VIRPMTTHICSMPKPPLPRGCYALEFNLDGYSDTLGLVPVQFGSPCVLHIERDAPLRSISAK
jgi:hypothetical protein